MVKYLKNGKDEIVEPCVELDDGTVLTLAEYTLQRLLERSIVLRSPDGTAWEITVDDTGRLRVKKK